jgi:hypothetical protein
MKNDLIYEQFTALAFGEAGSIPPPLDCFNKEGREVTYRLLSELPAAEGVTWLLNEEHRAARPQKRNLTGGML